MPTVIAEEGRAVQPGRNDPCPCGDGAKWKRCHGRPEGPPDGSPVLFTGAVTMSRAGNWDGEAAGRVRMYLDAGAGDAIHAFRYASWLSARGATLVCRSPMLRLFRASLPGAYLHDRHPLPPALFHATSLGLLGAAARGNMPRDAARPYLVAPSPRDLPGGAMNVGLCVRGDRTQAFDRWRSIHDESLLAPLFALPGIRWYRLDRGGFADWAETADLVTSLDLVISVDTGVAHLAGALGRSLWMLNRAPGAGDWGPDDRWDPGFLQDGPLYPAVRVFQQPDRGRWGDVIATVVEALRSQQ